MSFEAATRPGGGPGRWNAHLDEGWDIFGVTNGGYLMAITTRAMEHESGGRTLISATGSFVNPATPGPVAIEVQVLKQGRSLSTLRAIMSREGKDLAYVTAVYEALDRPKHEREMILTGSPDLPPPDECVPVAPARDAPIPPPFTGKVEMRIRPEDTGAIGTGGTGRPTSTGWLRLKDDEPIDAHAVVLATDAFPPAIFFSDLGVGWTPTVDLTVQVRNPHPTGWLACVFSTRFVTDGLLEEDGEIWDESGNLVALSRQLALVPR
ncbi:MAG: thioesterase family protein [Acidimicrobiia bacterium]